MVELESEAEAKKKEESLDKLKELVKDFLHEEDLVKRREAATIMRILAKDNLKVRGTLTKL
ncbi:hypothetical protein RYX36_028713 [Vicia faba]